MVADPTTARHPLVWTCVTCGFPIPDGAGSVNIPLAELSAHQPGRALVWRAQHDACLASSDVYGVDVDYLRDDRGILRWTLHLMEKNWFADSTWRGVIAAAFIDEGVGA